MKSELSILHIVESIDKAAVENWLIGILGHSTLSSFNHIVFCQLPGDDHKIKSLPSYVQVIVAKNGVGTLKYLYEINRVIREFKIGIVHSHHDVMTGWYWLAGLRKRWIWHFHNCDYHYVTDSHLKRNCLRILSYVGLVFAWKIIGISKAVQQDFTSKGFPWEMEVVNYGFSWVNDTSASASERKGKLKCIYLGRLNKNKNVEFLLELWNGVKLESVAELDIYGAGELVDTVKDFCSMENNVRYCGWSSDALSTMRQYDVLLFPRKPEQPEGFGIVLLEAMENGIFIVSSPYITEELHAYPRMKLLPLEPSKWIDHIIHLSTKPVEPTSDIRGFLNCFHADFCASSIKRVYLND